MRSLADIKVLGLATLTLALSAGAASAQTWVKQGSPGNLLSSAQLTLGNGILTEIDGTFSTPSATSVQGIPDLFGIYLDGFGTFSATTVGTAGTVFDTQLYLFDSTGHGVYFNDDDPSQIVGAGATLPAGDPLTPFTPGLYYLGISVEGATPQSAGGNIFPNFLTDGVPPTGLYGPTGAGGSGTLSKWNVTTADVESGSYSIRLTGTRYAGVVPEPSTYALLGLGLPPLAFAARRRRAAAATGKELR